MDKLLENKKGFSLLEVTVVMAIIGIMTVVSLASLQSNKADKELETAALGIEAAIREAQNNALAGKNASTALGCTKYNFTYGSNAYSVGGGGCPLTSYALGNGINFSNSSNLSFSFVIPFGTLSAKQSMQIVKGTKNYNICVTAAGSVTTQKSNCP
jgi:prepilin-type N-terminal cleavage/methylation domain-containing protein